MLHGFLKKYQTFFVFEEIVSESTKLATIFHTFSQEHQNMHFEVQNRKKTSEKLLDSRLSGFSPVKFDVRVLLPKSA